MKTVFSWTRLILIGYGIWASFIALWIYLTQDLPYHYPLDSLSVRVIMLVGIIIFAVIGLRMIKVDERTIYS